MLALPTVEVVETAAGVEAGATGDGVGGKVMKQPKHGRKRRKNPAYGKPLNSAPLSGIVEAFLNLFHEALTVCTCGNKCQCHYGGGIVRCPPECGNPLKHFGCHCLCPSERCACGGKCTCHYLHQYGGVPCLQECPTRGFDVCHLCHCTQRKET